MRDSSVDASSMAFEIARPCNRLERCRCRDRPAIRFVRKMNQQSEARHERPILAQVRFNRRMFAIGSQPQFELLAPVVEDVLSVGIELQERLRVRVRQLRPDACNIKNNQTGQDGNVIHLSNLCTEITEITEFEGFLESGFSVAVRVWGWGRTEAKFFATHLLRGRRVMIEVTIGTS